MMDPLTRHIAYTASHGEQLTEDRWLVKVDDVDRGAFPQLVGVAYVLYVEIGRGHGRSELVDTELDAETLRVCYRANNSGYLRHQQ